MPTVVQIERNERERRKDQRTIADWDYALELAGLETRATAQDVSLHRKRALTGVEMVEVYVGLAGVIPSFSQARKLARSHLLALREPVNDRPWEESVEEFTAQRVAAGQPVPPGPFRVAGMSSRFATAPSTDYHGATAQVEPAP